MSDKVKILDLEEGDCIIISSSEEAGAKICKSGKYWILYEIPQYGGNPQYVGAYSIEEVDGMIKLYSSWT